MNQVTLIGRVVRDIDQRNDGDKKPVKYTLAVDRKFKREGEPTADFINCTAFGKNADFAEKFLHKGTKIAVRGRIQTGSYTNKDGVKVYTTDVIVEEHEFVESRQAVSDAPITVTAETPTQGLEGFVNLPPTSDLDELPFS